METAHIHHYTYKDHNQTVIGCSCGQKQVLKPLSRALVLAQLQRQGEWAGEPVAIEAKTLLDAPPSNPGAAADTPSVAVPRGPTQSGELIRGVPPALSHPVPPLTFSDLPYVPPSEIKQRLDLIREAMRAVMEEGIHYGKVPGASKPGLFKPGAETLRLMFRLVPTREVERDPEVEKPHRGYIVNTILTHAVSGIVWGSGRGSCSTLESKYRWRYAKRACPQCHAEAIAKSKYAKGEQSYWYCKECKANYDQHAPGIADQHIGKVENPDIADHYNTVLKMADKRSLAAAVLDATGADALFSAPQHEEEEEDNGNPEDNTY